MNSFNRPVDRLLVVLCIVSTVSSFNMALQGGWAMGLNGLLWGLMCALRKQIYLWIVSPYVTTHGEVFTTTNSTTEAITPTS